MILTYSGKSAISAKNIAAEGGITAVRGDRGDINWGRARANTSLNPDISKSTNKRLMRELFREHGVPMPKLFTLDEVIPALHSGTALIGRPDRHMKGRGFWKIRTVADLAKALKGTRKKKAATHFMEYIDDARAPREYRVHIFLGKSIRISEKAHVAFHDYTTIKPTHNVNHVREAAKKAVAAVGLDFGAVDILANDNECWVTEVNSAPGVGGSMPRLYNEVFKKWGQEDAQSTMQGM